MEGLADAPFTLHDAIRAGLRILSYEEFPLAERPPRHIWLDGEKLEAHWTGVERKRKKELKGDTSDDDETWDDGTGRYNVNALELVSRG